MNNKTDWQDVERMRQIAEQIANEFAERLEAEQERMRKDLDITMDTAYKAYNNGKTHEEVCSERYKGLYNAIEQLKGIVENLRCDKKAWNALLWKVTGTVIVTGCGLVVSLIAYIWVNHL